VTIRFAYDGEGRRTKKTVSVLSLTKGTTISIDPKITSTTLYVDDSCQVINGKTVKYIFAGTIRIAEIRNGAIHYYHKDHLNSSSVLTDAKGNRIESAEYLPFGQIREYAGTWTTDYKFTDQEMDTESGLYNFNARLYDPTLGRFISPDPAVPDLSDPTNPRTFDPQMLNRYAHCRNNPMIYVDPTGLFQTEATAGNVGQSPGEGQDYANSGGGIGDTDGPDTSCLDGPSGMVVKNEDGSVAIHGPGNKRSHTFSLDELAAFQPDENGWAAIRLHLQLLDIITQGMGPITVFFDIAGVFATQIDIQYAKVDEDMKGRATALNFAGLFGAVGFNPSPLSMGVTSYFPEKLYLCLAGELDVQGFENIPLRLGHLCEDMIVLPGIFNLGQRLHLLQQFAHRVFLDEFR